MNRIIKISFLFLMILSLKNTYAQTQPDGILFQAVARDGAGNAAASRTIYVKIAILKNTSTGENVYTETHQVLSNDEGIFTVVIGKGLRVSGVPSLAGMDWRASIFFLNINMAIAPSVPTPGWDVNKEYVDLGSSQIWSVPYAYFSNRSIIADSAETIKSLLPGSKGGTGVVNDGKTITLEKNFKITGLGDLTFNTLGPTTLTLPTSGKFITDVSRDTLSNKIYVSPILLGSPKAVTPALNSSDSSIATTQYVTKLLGIDKSILDNRIDSVSLSTKTNIGEKVNISDTASMLSSRFARDTASLSKRIDSSLKIRDTALMLSNRFARDTASLSKRIDKLNFSSGDLASGKLNVSDTSQMLSLRIERDTASLSRRINYKLDTAKFKPELKSYLDSLKYLKYSNGDSLFVKGNTTIDSNLLVNGNLTVGGRLTLNSGLVFNDSLLVRRGARIDSSLLLKGNLNVEGVTVLNDSLIVKNISVLSKIKNDSTVLATRIGVAELKSNTDSTLFVNRLVNDSTIITTKLRSDSTDLRGKILLDSTNITSKLRSDSTVLATRIGVAELKSNTDSTLFVNRLVNDSTIITTKLRSDSTDLRGKILLDSTNITSKLRSDSTVLATRIGVAELKSNTDSTLFVNRLVNDSTIITTKLRSDSTSLRTKILLDSTNITTKFRSDSINITSKLRSDSTDLRAKILLDSSSITTKLRSDSTKINTSLVDSANALNARINLKVNIADTAAMLSNRITRDTASLSNRINLLSSSTSTGKVSVSDTAAMLAPYARKFTKDIPVNIATGKSIGKYKNGDIIPATGKTLDEFMLDIATEIIHPTYLSPSVTISSVPLPGNVEIGSTFSVALSSVFTKRDGGAITTTTYKLGSSSLGSSNDNVNSISTDKVYSVVIDYAAGAVKNNNLGTADSVGILPSGSVSSSLTFTPKLKKYWGASSSLSPTDADIIGSNTIGTDCDWVTSSSSSSKSSFTIPISGGAKYIFYAFPVSTPDYSLIDITNISVGGFDSFSAFNKISRTIVNSSGYSQTYNIYVSKNLSSETISNIIITNIP